MRHLEKIANIAIIFAVAIVAATLIRNEFFKKNPAQSINLAIEGKRIGLSEIQFPRNRNVLLMALSVNCRYCKESLPFYKKLTAQGNGYVDIVALFPQPRGIATSYLKDDDISVNQIISGPLGAVGITATPTLLFIDKSGIIKKEWVGYLGEDKQQEVMSLIGH